MRSGSAGDPFTWYISHPAKMGPSTSQLSRSPSEVSTKAPFRVPTSNRTLLMANRLLVDPGPPGGHRRRRGDRTPIEKGRVTIASDVATHEIP